MQIAFTDNTTKKFICVYKGAEPKGLLTRLNKNIIEYWFEEKWQQKE